MKYEYKKSPLYENLISAGQTNSFYGAINSEESNIEDNVEEEINDNSESTLIINEYSRNKFFDLSRLFFGVMMCVLICSIGIVRWYEYSKNTHDIYWITSPIIKELVWVSNLN
jgi:hypothetical protein